MGSGYEVVAEARAGDDAAGEPMSTVLPRVYTMPAGLALGTAVGLVSALLGDGIWDTVSWVALGAPVVVVAWHVGRSLGLRRDRRTRGRRRNSRSAR